VTASASIPEASGRAAPRTPTTITSPPGYLSLLVGRGLYSKATSTCQTPAGMLTLDQVLAALYAGDIAGQGHDRARGRATESRCWRGTSRPLSATEWTARPRYRLVFCRLLPS
jgi:hypothetical protein